MNQSTHSADEQIVPCLPSAAHHATVPQIPPYLNVMPLTDAAVVAQPQPLSTSYSDWSTVPLAGVPNCPRGLEYLSTLDQLQIQHKINLFIGTVANHEYTIKNSLGQSICTAIEDTDYCKKICYGNFRSFDMKVLDLYKNEIIHFNRPLACNDCCCCPYCLQSIEITSPSDGQMIGSVHKECTWWYPNYKIKNQCGETVLRIKGPRCMCSCGSDINFKIVDVKGEEIGQISKKWMGVASRESVFGINFPMDLDVKLKATLIGACMLINLMHIESESWVLSAFCTGIMLHYFSSC